MESEILAPGCSQWVKVLYQYFETSVLCGSKDKVFVCTSNIKSAFQLSLSVFLVCFYQLRNWWRKALMLVLQSCPIKHESVPKRQKTVHVRVIKDRIVLSIQILQIMQCQSIECCLCAFILSHASFTLKWWLKVMLVGQTISRSQTKCFLTGGDQTFILNHFF